MSESILKILRSYARMALWGSGRLTPDYVNRIEAGDPLMIRGILSVRIDELRLQILREPHSNESFVLSHMASIQTVIDIIDREVSGCGQSR